MEYGVNRRVVLKGIIYVILTTLCYMLPAARGMVMGYGLPTVNVMPFLIAAVGFFEGPYMGGAVGLYGGLLLSLSSSTVEGAEGLILALFGIFCGSAAAMMMRKVLPSVMFCGIGLLAGRGIISATYYRIFYGVSFLGVLGDYLRIIALSALPGALCYFIVSAVSRRFFEEEDT